LKDFKTSRELDGIRQLARSTKVLVYAQVDAAENVFSEIKRQSQSNNQARQAEWENREQRGQNFRLAPRQPKNAQKSSRRFFSTISSVHPRKTARHSLVALAKAVGPKGTVFGLDLSDKMLQRAKISLAKFNLLARTRLCCADATQLPYEANSMDAVFMSFTLELFDTPEIPKGAGRVRARVAPRWTNRSGCHHQGG
jgi:hypothetical protein